MYVHPAFKIHHAVGLAFAAARGFGHVIACEGGRPVAALLPFHVMEANGRLPRVQFHVARPNPLAHLATKGGPWLIAVAGDDAYVSPHWYASAEQVPTWLYETVQLCGPVHVVPTSHTADHLDRLVAQFESALAPKPPWVADGTLSSQRRATLMESIVAIEMTVETVDGSELDKLAVPGFYTYAGFQDFFIPQLAAVADKIEGEKWVMGELAEQKGAQALASSTAPATR